MGRKLNAALLSAGLLMLTPGIANSLGLGKITLNSMLSEPLDAEIELVQVRELTAGEILAAIAPANEFDTVGLDRLSGLDFNVIVNPDGRSYMTVKSEKPIRDPYLNFIVELRWPTGNILKEYTLLLDPRAYDTAVPSNAPENGVEPGLYGPTRSQESLWNIASTLRPGSRVTVPQMMLAIQRLNPRAFEDGNINNLKADVMLKAPTEAEATAVPASEALVATEKQNRQWTKLNEQEQKARLAAAPQVPEQELKTVIADPQEKIHSQSKALSLKNEEIKNLKAELVNLTEQIENTASPQNAVTFNSQPVLETANTTEAAKPVVTATSAVERGLYESPKIDALIKTVPNSEANSSTLASEKPVVAEKQVSKKLQVTEPVAVPVPVPAVKKTGWFTTLTTSPYPAAGGGILALFIAGLFLMRKTRRAKEEVQEVESHQALSDGMNSDSADAQKSGSDTSETRGYKPMKPEYSNTENEENLLSSVFTSENNNVVTEADRHIANGNIKLGIQLLETAALEERDNGAIHLKLMELFAAENNMQAFTKHEDIVQQLCDSDVIRRATELRDSLQTKQVTEQSGAEPESSDGKSSPVSDFEPDTHSAEIGCTPDSTTQVEEKSEEALSYALDGLDFDLDSLAEPEPSVAPQAPESDDDEDQPVVSENLAPGLDDNDDGIADTTGMDSNIMDFIMEASNETSDTEVIANDDQAQPIAIAVESETAQNDLNFDLSTIADPKIDDEMAAWLENELGSGTPANDTLSPKQAEKQAEKQTEKQAEEPKGEDTDTFTLKLVDVPTEDDENKPESVSEM